ncbi:hypothetical protein R5R35_008931 [Gryllus longicercus]|uniref:Uncharacterized protein n=1 Tax=Gryllus longicercus TaxID=2509291 RepID=A0AAN9Z948_9ORTH
MEVNILDCNINVKQLYEKISKCATGAVSLFVGNRNDTFEKSVLSTVTGHSRNQVINAFLIEVCREVNEKHHVKKIIVNCWLDASDNEPCLAIACLASTYHVASEGINTAIELIIGRRQKLYCDDHVDVVPADLIQVKASSSEINLRINSFIQRRREQVNKDNIRDFCINKFPLDETSCARVNAVKIHRKDCKSHLRVRKVFNVCGPQTQNTMNEAFNQLGDDATSEEGCAKKRRLENRGRGKTVMTHPSDNKEFALNERLRNIEEHLGFDANTSSDVLERLKKIEDKILYLEGLSPEYFEFRERKSKNESKLIHKTQTKVSYSSSELSQKIKDLEANMDLGKV